MKQRIALALALILLALPAASLAASYVITDYAVDVDVDTTGTGHFTESLTYDFDGSHNGFLVEIRHEAELRMGELAVSVDGIRLDEVDALDGVPYTYEVETGGERTRIKTFTPGGSGVRSLRITYRLGGFALRYKDAARINHLFLPGGTAYESVSVRVALPGEDAADILAFAHGLAGSEDLSVRGGVLTLAPLPAAEGEALEMDVLFPAQWLPDARAIQTDIREEVLATEARIRQEAVDRAQRQERIAEIVVYVTLAALAAYAVLGLWLFSRMKARYGLRQAVMPRVDMALLAEIPAALAQPLTGQAVDSSALCATLLELVDARALDIRYEGGDTVFTVRQMPQGLCAPQQAAWDWLFAGRDTLYISELDAGGDTKAAQAFTDRYNQWKVGVQQDAYDRGWIFHNRGARAGALLGVCCAGLVIAGVLIRFGLWPLAIAAGLLMAVYAVVFSRVRSLTDEGEARRDAIEGFAQCYEDRLESAPGQVLSHTPLLMALGYLPSLADWLDAHPGALGEDVYDDGAPLYMASVGWQMGLLSMDQSVREAQSHNLGVISESSGASGGGFSGGTGGSSHGAW